MIFTVNIQKSMIMIESRKKKIIITMIEIAFYKLNKKTKFPARRAENSTQNRTVTSVTKILHDPKTLTNTHGSAYTSPKSSYVSLFHWLTTLTNIPD